MKSALVIGFKKSGLAACKLLLKNGYKVTLTDRDSNYNEDDYLELKDKVTFHLGGHPDELLDHQYDLVVKNPGIPYTVPFVSSIALKHDIITEIELAYRMQKYSHEYIALTGTNGKTTTVTLIHEMLSLAFDNCILAGNVGTPLSEIILNETQKSIITLELSNFQLLGMPTFRPSISAILNLSPDHLDYMPSLDAYYKSKMNIYRNQDESDTLILNADDNVLKSYATNIKAKLLTFSLHQDASAHCDLDYVYYLQEPILEIDKITVKGDHNLQNIMCALIVAKQMGVSNEIIQKVAYRFLGVAHRLAYIGLYGHKKCYNDSKSTSPQATITALKAIQEPHYLILGGFDKGLDYHEIAPYLTYTKEILVYGANANVIHDIFKTSRVFDTLDDVMKYVSKQDTDWSVIFSPGTSSYDQYENFEQRGIHFESIVKAGV